MKSIRMLVTACAMLAAAQAPAVFAHPRLVSSVPGAQASVQSARQISLRFTERLMPQLTGIDVSSAGVAGTGHDEHVAHAATPPLPAIQTSFSSDGKTLIARFASALPRGTYIVKWHAVAADTHRVEGQFGFTVR